MGRDEATPTRGQADEALVDRREFLELSGGPAAAGTVGLAGCSGTPSGGSGADDQGDGGDGGDQTTTGHIATRVTDQPTDFDDIRSCVVTIDGV